MKLNKELEALLNNQINMELAASYQYQAMAAYFDERAPTRSRFHLDSGGVPPAFP